MRWARHTARMRQMINTYKLWSESLRGQDHIEDVYVGGSIILKWFYSKGCMKAWIRVVDQDIIQWLAVVKTVMDIMVPYTAVNMLRS
jgi:hypothetical protein